MAGVNPATVERFARGMGEAWREQVRAAEAESVEPVEDVLRKAALAGEPWAVRLVLGRMGHKRWRDDVQRHEVKGIVAHVEVTGGEAGVDAALLDLVGKLSERSRLSERVPGGAPPVP